MRTRNLDDFKRSPESRTDKVTSARISREDWKYLMDREVAIGRFIRSLVAEQVELIKEAEEKHETTNS
jgi:hypothetical protein